MLAESAAPPVDSLRSGAASTRSVRKAPLSQLAELEQEMKLLQWHKLANEAALKAALIRTKKLKREQKVGNIAPCPGCCIRPFRRISPLTPSPHPSAPPRAPPCPDR
jgi:hypothetical protein